MFMRIEIILTLYVTYVASQTDVTRQDGAYGSNVVEGVISVLRDACIFPDNKLFLRRLAYVESQDGVNPETYRKGYYGGIWKVDRDMFDATKSQIHPELSDNLRHKLGIAWSNTTWEDLRKPLFSGLAASIYLQTKGAPDNLPTTIGNQSTYWTTNYRPLGFPQKFQKLAGDLDVGCKTNERTDLLFLIDTSGPVFTSPHIKEFLKNYINSVTISPDSVQIAVESYGAIPQVNIPFTAYSNKIGLLAAVDAMTLTSGGADVKAALSTASQDVFNPLKGSRNDVAKVLILISSAKMNVSVEAMIESIKLKNKGISIYTIGTGLSNPKLHQLASAPFCIHSYTLRDYTELVNLHPFVAQTSCRVAVGLQVGDYTYSCGSDVLVRIQSSSLGTSVKVSVDKGSAEVYASYVNSQPSKDVNNLNQSVTNTQPASFFIKDKRPLTLSVETELRNIPTCYGNIRISVEPAVSKRAECQKKKPDIVLLLDSSSTKSKADFQSMVEFASRFANNFKIGPDAAQIAMVTYAEHPLNQFWLKAFQHQGDVQNAIRTVQMQGSKPNLASALKFIREQTLTPSYGLRKDSSRIVVVVTGSSVQSAFALPEAHLLKNLGVRVVVVATDGAATDPVIDQLGSGPEHVLKLKSYSAMTSAVSKAVVESCGDVQLVCMENGLQRNCRIEDLLASIYGKLIVPDHGAIPNSPCSVQLPVPLNIQRFPHPTDKDRFIICDNKGQTYLGLCPLNEIYNGRTSQCEYQGPQPSTQHPGTPFPALPQTTSGYIPAQTTRQTPGPQTQGPSVPPQASASPCSGDSIAKGLYFFPYFSDSHKFIHCSGVNASTLETCDKYKIWRQQSLQCEYEYITDENGNTIPSIHNPCIVGVSGYFPHPTDNRAFIQCDAFGEGFLLKCEGNTHFVPRQNSCQ